MQNSGYRLLRPDLLQLIQEHNCGYCLCTLERCPDTVCMCREFRDGDAEVCECGVWQRAPQE